MIKVNKIIEVKPFYIICQFNTGEVKKLIVDDVLSKQKNVSYLSNVINSAVFTKVKIGEFGQLYWENAAEMKDEKGKSFACEYDMSPEFVYHNAMEIN